MFWSKNVVGSPFLDLQTRPNLARKAGSMLGSLSLSLKKLQCAKPTVCAPKSVTISFNDMPFAAKACCAADTVEPGPGSATSDVLDTTPSRLPVATSYRGPPAMATESRVARVIISAHETVEGHAVSNAFFISSISSNPRTVPFAPEAFSDLLPLVESINMDASHP